LDYRCDKCGAKGTFRPGKEWKEGSPEDPHYDCGGRWVRVTPLSDAEKDPEGYQAWLARRKAAARTPEDMLRVSLGLDGETFKAGVESVFERAALRLLRE